MPTLSMNSNAGVIRGIPARTDYTLRMTIRDPLDASKNVSGYAFRAAFRMGDGARIVKTLNTSTGGGITIQSAASGRIEIALDNSMLPPMAGGVLEVVEYSGGSLSGDETDRFRFFCPILGGSGASF